MLSKERIDEVRKMREQGMSLFSIHVQTGISREHIKKALGDTPSASNNGVKKQDRQQIVSLLSEGLSVSTIAERLSCSVHLIYKVKKELRDGAL